MNDYWIVIEKFTGRIIAHCGNEKDAFMMVSFDSEKRIHKKQRFIMDNVININFTKPKKISGQQGLPEAKIPINSSDQELSLPEGKQIPVNPK